eukprot:13726556-Heterocapsa_arctica.AAC.1
MLTRDSLSNALALAKASEIELLSKKNRVMQYRLDIMAAAAPLHTVQVAGPLPAFALEERGCDT